MSEALSEVNCWCFVIHVNVAGAQTLQISCTFVVSTCPRTVTTPLWWLLMTNIIYANVIRPGKTIAELRVPTEIYHWTQRDSKPSIKILDFSRLNLDVINKVVEEREVCHTTSWSLVSCVTPGKGHGQILRWRRWCLDLCPTGSLRKCSFKGKILLCKSPSAYVSSLISYLSWWPQTCSATLFQTDKQDFCALFEVHLLHLSVTDVFSHLLFKGGILACVNMTQLTGCAESYK